MLRSAARRGFRWGLGLLAAAALAPPAPGRADTPAAPPAEAAVRAQLAHGRPVDLTGQSIPGAFLARFLEDAPAAGGAFRGVRLVGAKVVGDVNLANADVRPDVRLEGFNFTGAVLLSNTTFRKGLALDGSVFAGRVEADGAVVGGPLTAERTTFAYPLGPAGFERVWVQGPADFDGAVFHRGADFDQARIDGTLSLVNTRFASPTLADVARAGRVAGGAVGPAALGLAFDPPDASFNRVAVKRDVELAGATFAGAVDFTFAQVGHNLNARATRFEDPRSDPVFSDVKVGGTLFLTGAVFAGGADLDHVEVGVHVNAANAQVRGRDRKFVMTSAKVGGTVFLSETVFAGGVVLDHTEAAINLEAIRTKFRGRRAAPDDGDRAALFNTVRVGRYAFFDGAEFDDLADFRYAAVGLDFSLGGAQFRGAVPPLFVRAQIKGNLSLDEQDRPALLAAGADFTLATVGTDLSAAGVVVRGPVSFGTVRVGGWVVLNEASVRGEVNFVLADVGRGVVARGAAFLPPPVPAPGNPPLVDFAAARVGAADFTGTVFAGPVQFTDVAVGLWFTAAGAQFLGTADFTGTRAKGSFTLDRTSFARTVYLRNCDLQQVEMAGTDWSDADDIWLDGTTYQSATTPGVGQEASQDRLRRLAGRAEFSPEVYTRAEAYFRARGEAGAADRVLFARKEREQEAYLAEAVAAAAAHPFRAAFRYALRAGWDRVHFALVGYGAHPEWCLPWAGLVVLIGVVAFRPSAMEKREDKTTAAGGHLPRPAPATWRDWWSDLGREYNRVLYSIDLFVPAVSLYQEKTWRPKAGWWWTRAWWVVHKTLGWVIVPIGLIALTGVVKL